MLAAGGGTARFLAGAGNCTARSLAAAEAEDIELELLRRPRGRMTQARQSVDVCLSLFYLVGAHHKILQKYTNRKNITKSYDILGKVRRTEDQPTDQCTNDCMCGPVSFRR